MSTTFELNWTPIPYFRIAFALVIGILFQNFYPLSQYVIYTGITVVFIVTLFPPIVLSSYREKIRGLALLIFSMLLGMLFYMLHEHQEQKKIIWNVTKPIFIKGQIVDQYRSMHNLRFRFRVKQIKYNDQIVNHKCDINITFGLKDSIARTYLPGQSLLLYCKPKHIMPALNPLAFDFAQNSKYNGVYQQCFVKSGYHFLLPDTKVNVNDYFFIISEFIQKTLSKYLKDDAAYGIAASILVGKRNKLPPEITRAYANAGAIHILAVSGLHVGIFVGVIILLMNTIKRDFKFKRWINFFLVMFFAWSYVIVTGMSPSVVRAATMISFYLFGKNLQRTANPVNILSIAAIVMLLYNPFMIFQLSFQFSFLSLLGILYFQPKMAAFFEIENKFIRYLWTLINVSISAQVFLFPFILYYMNQFPVYFILSSLVVVPAATIMIFTGLIIVIIEVIYSPLNHKIGQFYEILIQYINKFILMIQDLPFSTINNINITKGQLLLCVLSFIFMTLWIEKRWIKSFYAMLSIILAIISIDVVNRVINNYHEQIIIYDDHHALMDVIKGRNIFQYADKEISKEKIQWLAGNFRRSVFTKEIIESKSKFANFKNTIIYFYDDPQDLDQIVGGSTIDVLYIATKSKNLPNTILGKLVPEVVVLNKSLPPWVINAWKSANLEHKFVVHDMSSEGIFVLPDCLKSKI